MARMILDYIDMMIAKEKRRETELTYEDWCKIRRTGTPEEIEEAVERMMQQGGYDCLVTDDGTMIGYKLNWIENKLN